DAAHGRQQRRGGGRLPRLHMPEPRSAGRRGDRIRERRGGLLGLDGVLEVVGLATHQVCGPGCTFAGTVSGIRSRGGIGVVPRTTTMLRKRSSTWAAAPGSTAPFPLMTPRRNQRG